MATTALKPLGTVTGRYLMPPLSGNRTSHCPHATTVPSCLRARLSVPPAAIATTSPKPSGTVASPDAFSPHATTVPSRRDRRDVAQSAGRGDGPKKIASPRYDRTVLFEGQTGPSAG